MPVTVPPLAQAVAPLSVETAWSAKVDLRLLPAVPSVLVVDSDLLGKVSLWACSLHPGLFFLHMINP